MFDLIKKSINKVLSILNLKIVRLRRETGGDITQITGLQTNVIVDVGVSGGTPWLYQSFPEAEFILVDPLEIPQSQIANMLLSQNYSFEKIALSNCAGSLKLYRDIVNPSLSSFERRTSISDRQHPLEEIIVQVKTLDDLYDKYEVMRNGFGLKIDTEGFELNILKGAIRSLAVCDFIILEVSTSQRFHNGYNCSELMTFLYHQGFHLKEILRVASNSENQILTADMVFTKYAT